MIVMFADGSRMNSDDIKSEHFLPPGPRYSNNRTFSNRTVKYENFEKKKNQQLVAGRYLKTNIVSKTFSLGEKKKKKFLKKKYYLFQSYTGVPVLPVDYQRV